MLHVCKTDPGHVVLPGELLETPHLGPLRRRRPEPQTGCTTSGKKPKVTMGTQKRNAPDDATKEERARPGVRKKIDDEPENRFAR